MASVSTRSPDCAQRAGESLGPDGDGPTGMVPSWWNGPTGVAPHVDPAVEDLRFDVASLWRELAALRAELRTVTAPGRRPLELGHVPLADVARELHISARKLVAMSLAGKFPALLKVTPRHYLMKRADLDNWKAGRWTVEIAVRAAMVVDGALGQRVVNRRRRRTDA